MQDWLENISLELVEISDAIMILAEAHAQGWKDELITCAITATANHIGRISDEIAQKAIVLKTE